MPELLDVTLVQVFGLLLTCLAGYWLKGLSGFGSALLFIPMVSLLFDPRTAIVTAPLIDLFVGAAMARTFHYDAADRAALLRMVGLLGVGAIVGAALTGTLPDAVLLALVGAAVVALGARLVLRPPSVVAADPSPRRRRLLWVACVVGGLFGGLIGISGPPVIAAARPMLDRDVFRRRLAFLFMAESVVKLATYAITGIWTEHVTRVALIASPAVAIGLMLGYRTHLSIGERTFNVVIGGALTILGTRVLYASCAG